MWACAGRPTSRATTAVRRVRIDGAQASDEVTAVFSSDGTELGTAVAALEGDLWQFDVTPAQDWPAGPVTVTLRARRR